ncbi:MAG: T9SS type A sorting domain-containing protein, partial [Candidatus Kapaibacterium sp.]
TSASRWLTIKSIEFIDEPDDVSNSIYPKDFAWVNTPPNDTVLNIGGPTLQLPVRFTPTKAGMERVRVLITHNAEPVTSNPVGTWRDTVYVVGYGIVENQPFIKGKDYGRVLACNNPTDSVTVGNSAKAGSTNSDRVLDSLWISGPDAARFLLASPPSSAAPIVIKPNTEYKHPVTFVTEPLKVGSYAAVIHARFSDGLIITDPLSATSYVTSMSVSVNDPVKILNMTAAGTTTDMSLRATSAEWTDVYMTRFTATLRYNAEELAYVRNSMKLGPATDNTWKIDSVREIRSQATSVVELRVTASGTTPVVSVGDLATFSMQLLIGPTRITECHTDLDVLVQTNMPDTSRDECVVVTTKGNAVFLTGCFLDGRFISISETPFALQSVTPQPAGNGTARIEYSLGFDAVAEIEVIDATGIVVATPVHDYQKRGSYTLLFSVHDLASGMYIVRLRSGGVMRTLPFVILH